MGERKSYKTLKRIKIDVISKDFKDENHQRVTQEETPTVSLSTCFHF